jgi:uncharacterized protein YjlB
MLLETAKKYAEQITGIGRATADELIKLVRPRQPNKRKFSGDQLIPNHPHWPVIHYRGGVRLPAQYDPASVFEDLFALNGWSRSWRGETYDYAHYPSRIHEVLGIASGHAEVRFGGKSGRVYRVKAGDVVVLPAGTGHQCISASRDFMAVGAYPKAGTYDECRATRADHDRALKTIAKVPPPRRDPVYGPKGPLVQLWQRG